MSDNSFDIGQSRIEFFGADQPDKLRGARRDYLFINECNNVNKEVFNQLEVRTNKQVYLDYNPTNEFWVHEAVMNLPNTLFVKSNYLDNPFIDESIIKSIERRKETDPNWWKVFGLGELGSNEGVIFPGINIVQKFPADCRWIGYGLDFGYSNDPTSLILCGLFNGELYFSEVMYKTGMTNSDLHDVIKANKIGLSDIVADSADPKSIEELRRRGWNVKGAVKGPNSIMTGIDILKQYKLNVTASSVNLIKEFRNYSWKIDRATNKYINEPMDTFNHGIDAIRYLCMYKLTKRKELIY
jgi:phage terminase large subunit